MRRWLHRAGGVASGCVLLCASVAAQDAVSVLRKAHELGMAHRPQEAEAVLRPYLAKWPKDVEALTLLAEMQRAGGDDPGAQQTLLTALAASPDAVAPNLAMGDLLLAGRHDPEAMDRFETVLSAAPRNPRARAGELAAATDLAATALQAGHPEVALEVWKHARTALPDEPKLLLALGIQADELGMFADAGEALTAARKLAPTDLDVLYALGRLEIDRQHMADAEADFREYLRARPGDASAHFALGRVLTIVQRKDEARAEFTRSIQLQPVQTESYYELGQIELEAQQDAKAEPLFLKTLERDPTHGGALAGMGVLRFRAKDYAKAEEYLAAAEKTASEYGPAHYYRGLALARLGRKDEADAELRRATELGKALPVH